MSPAYRAKTPGSQVAPSDTPANFASPITLGAAATAATMSTHHSPSTPVPISTNNSLQAALLLPKAAATANYALTGITKSASVRKGKGAAAGAKPSSSTSTGARVNNFNNLTTRASALNTGIQNGGNDVGGTSRSGSGGMPSVSATVLGSGSSSNSGSEKTAKPVDDRSLSTRIYLPSEHVGAELAAHRLHSGAADGSHHAVVSGPTYIVAGRSPSTNTYASPVSAGIFESKSTSTPGTAATDIAQSSSVVKTPNMSGNGNNGNHATIGDNRPSLDRRTSADANVEAVMRLHGSKVQGDGGASDSYNINNNVNMRINNRHARAASAHGHLENPSGAAGNSPSTAAKRLVKDDGSTSPNRLISKISQATSHVPAPAHVSQYLESQLVISGGLPRSHHVSPKTDGNDKDIMVVDAAGASALSSSASGGMGEGLWSAAAASAFASQLVGTLLPKPPKFSPQRPHPIPTGAHSHGFHAHHRQAYSVATAAAVSSGIPVGMGAPGSLGASLGPARLTFAHPIAPTFVGASHPNSPAVVSSSDPQEMHPRSSQHQQQHQQQQQEYQQDHHNTHRSQSTRRPQAGLSEKVGLSNTNHGTRDSSSSSTDNSSKIIANTAHAAAVAVTNVLHSSNVNHNNEGDFRDGELSQWGSHQKHDLTVSRNEVDYPVSGPVGRKTIAWYHGIPTTPNNITTTPIGPLSPSRAKETLTGHGSSASGSAGREGASDSTSKGSSRKSGNSSSQHHSSSPNSAKDKLSSSSRSAGVSKARKSSFAGVAEVQKLLLQMAEHVEDRLNRSSSSTSSAAVAAESKVIITLLKMLASIIENDEGAKQVFVEEGAIPILVETLRTHQNDRDVQVQACSTLRKLISKNDNAMASLVQYGGMDLVLSAVEILGKEDDQNQSNIVASKANSNEETVQQARSKNTSTVVVIDSENPKESATETSGEEQDGVASMDVTSRRQSEPIAKRSRRLSFPASIKARDKFIKHASNMLLGNIGDTESVYLGSTSSHNLLQADSSLHQPHMKSSEARNESSDRASDSKQSAFTMSSRSVPELSDPSTKNAVAVAERPSRDPNNVADATEASESNADNQIIKSGGGDGDGVTNIDFSPANLVSALLENYLDQTFLDELEDMSLEDRADTVQHLLLLFTKIGRLLTASSFISVEVDLRTAMEKMAREACKILTAERAIILLANHDRSELILTCDVTIRTQCKSSKSSKRQENADPKSILQTPHKTAGHDESTSSSTSSSSSSRSSETSPSSASPALKSDPEATSTALVSSKNITNSRDQQVEEILQGAVETTIAPSLQADRRRVSAERGVAGWVFRRNNCLNLARVDSHDAWDKEVDFYIATPQEPKLMSSSILAVPIRSRTGETAGVIIVQASADVHVNEDAKLKAAKQRRNGAEGEEYGVVGSGSDPNSSNSSNLESVFNQEDEFLLRILGLQAGINVQNSHYYGTIEATKKKVEVLLDTTRSLSSELELDKLIQAIMQAAKDLLDADRCTLFLVDDEKGELWGVPHSSQGGPLREIRFPITAGIAGYVATSGQAVNIAHAYSDSRFNKEIDRQTGYVTRNMLTSPIKNIAGQTIGVTQMINKRIGTFGPEDEQLLSAFSAQAAVAIEKSYLFKKTEEMRSHLQSILSSITSCVLTLSEKGHMITMNRPWFMNAVGKTEEELQTKPIEEWLGSGNENLLKDIQTVLRTSQSVYSTEYELQGPKGCTFVNYNIVPLIGTKKGVVVVLEDISQEKRMMTTLGRYMSPALAKQVMQEGGSQLGGTRQKVTVLFSDIRSFTTLAESMEPSEVVDLLNAHFTDAVNAIIAEHGVLDKFIGDAVMAVFGIPFVQPEDSIHACSAALRMRDNLRIFNENRRAKGMIELSIGIGINTGEALSGNIGSEKRMEYTVVGDSVNLASRMEGITKNYGVMILLSEFTQVELGDKFITQELDLVQVVGKTEPIRIYELIGRAGDVFPEEEVTYRREFSEALTLYRQRQFEEAQKIFEKNAGIHKSSKVFTERCRKMISDPPLSTWNGVYMFTSK